MGEESTTTTTTASLEKTKQSPVVNKDDEQPSPKRHPIHPNALKKRISTIELRKQTRNRRLLFIFNSLTTFLFVGAALGWGPMQLMMEKNGSYSEECTEEEQLEGIICDEQTSKLLKVGILITSTQVLSPLFGWFVDKYGPRRTAYVQATLTVMGYIIAILSTSTNTSPLLYLGFGLLSLASWFGSLLIIQLGLYFEGHTISRVIFVLNTFFDGGTITYLALYWIQVATDATTTAVLSAYLGLAALIYGGAVYFWTVAVPMMSSEEERDTSYAPSTRFSRLEPSLLKSHDLEDRLKNNITQSIRGFSTRHLGSISALNNASGGSRFNASGGGGLNASKSDFHASGGAFHASGGGGGAFSKGQKRSMNNNKKQNNSTSQFSSSFSVEDGEDDIMMDFSKPSSNADDDDDGEEEEEEATPTSKSTNYVLVADRDPRGQLTSPPFIMLCIFFALQVGMCNWNLATQRDFLKGLGDDEHDNLYLTIFTLLTPVSILGAPFVDQTILHFGWTVSLQMINVLSLGYMVVKVASENLNVQIVGFVIYSFYRSFLFGISFSYLPTLIAGPIVGRAAGIMAGLAGIVNLLQMPLVNLAMDRGDGDFFVPNLVFLCLTSITILVICMIGRYNALETDAKERKEKGTTPADFLDDLIEEEDEEEEDEDDEEDGRDGNKRDLLDELIEEEEDEDEAAGNSNEPTEGATESGH